MNECWVVLLSRTPCWAGPLNLNGGEAESLEISSLRNVNVYLIPLPCISPASIRLYHFKFV